MNESIDVEALSAEACDEFLGSFSMFALSGDPKPLKQLVADAIRTALATQAARHAEYEAWRAVAVESNIAIDTYLRELLPSLPEHYGMPVDGIRMVVEAREAKWRELFKLREIVGPWTATEERRESELRAELGVEL